MIPTAFRGAIGATALLALLTGTAARAGDPKPPVAPPPSPLAEKIDEAVRRGTNGAFWGTVLVEKGGQVLFAKGYGFADYAKKPNAPDTLFEIASTSKQVAATAILRLEQQKKLKTTDDLGVFFQGVPEDKRKVTVQHLLNHTSGLSPKLGVPYASTITRDEYWRQMLEPPLVAEPGATFSYSNVGYALLAAIVEVASGTSFEEYVKKEVFGAAGLADTGFIGDSRLAKSERISSRLNPDGNREWTAANWFWGWGYRGMGGVVTTALDLVKWDRALRGEKVLGAAAKAKLYAPAKGGYACGWFVETTDRGTTKAWHSGGVMGFRSLVSRWLDEDAMVVVLTNDKNEPFGIEKAIVGLLFPMPKIEADIDAESYTLTASRAFIATEGLSWEVARDGESVRLRLKHGTRTPATIRIPRASSARLIEQLEAAANAHEGDSANGAPAMEGGIYFAAYAPGTKKLHLDEDLELRVQTEYVGTGARGERVEDPRATLILVDAPHHMWPLMVKMNAATTRALWEAVKKASS